MAFHGGRGACLATSGDCTFAHDDVVQGQLAGNRLYALPVSVGQPRSTCSGVRQPLTVVHPDANLNHLRRKSACSTLCFPVQLTKDEQVKLQALQKLALVRKFAYQDSHICCVLPGLFLGMPLNVGV